MSRDVQRFSSGVHSAWPVAADRRRRRYAPVEVRSPSRRRRSSNCEHGILETFCLVDLIGLVLRVSDTDSNKVDATTGSSLTGGANRLLTFDNLKSLCIECYDQWQIQKRAGEAAVPLVTGGILKQGKILHQNAQFLDKIFKNFMGKGHSPLPDSTPYCSAPLFQISGFATGYDALTSMHNSASD